MTDIRESELYDRWLSGCAAAGEELVLRHHDALVAWIARRVWANHVANDVAQEVWLDAMKGGYLGRGSFRGWLFRIARSRLCRLYRSLTMAIEEISRSQISLSTWIHALEVQQAIEEIGNTEQRRALRLGINEGLSAAEIAAATQVVEKTARSRIRLGIEKVRARLSQSDPETS